MDIQKTLLEKIEHDDVTPIARWRFLARGYGLWALSGLLLIFGSLGVASILYILTKNDWDIYSEIHESAITHVISTLPVLWLGLFCITVYLLYIDIKHTSRGYKYNAMSLILSTVALSIFIGIGLHVAGFGQEIDEIIREHAPHQAHMFNPRLQGLTNPDQGVIMGRVTIIEQQTSSTTHIYIENPLLQGIWIVVTTQDTILPKKGIAIHDHIRVLGSTRYDIDNAHTLYFDADAILPFNKLDKDFRTRNPKGRSLLSQPPAQLY